MRVLRLCMLTWNTLLPACPVNAVVCCTSISYFGLLLVRFALPNFIVPGWHLMDCSSRCPWLAGSHCWETSSLLLMLPVLVVLFLEFNISCQFMGRGLSSDMVVSCCRASVRMRRAEGGLDLVEQNGATEERQEEPKVACVVVNIIVGCKFSRDVQIFGRAQTFQFAVYSERSAKVALLFVMHVHDRGKSSREADAQPAQ